MNNSIQCYTIMKKLKEPTKPSHLLENQKHLRNQTSYKLNRSVGTNHKLPVPIGFTKNSDAFTKEMLCKMKKEQA